MQPTAQNGDHEITMSILLKRVAAEIEGLSDITDRLQHTTLEVATVAGSAHFETIQELDRLHQSLQQLAFFLDGLADSIPEGCSVATAPHATNINLSSILNALVGTSESSRVPSACSEDEFELFDYVDPGATDTGVAAAQSAPAAIARRA